MAWFLLILLAGLTAGLRMLLLTGVIDGEAAEALAEILAVFVPEAFASIPIRIFFVILIGIVPIILVEIMLVILAVVLFRLLMGFTEGEAA